MNTISVLPNNAPSLQPALAQLLRQEALDGETALQVEVLAEIKRLFSLLWKVRITTPHRQFHAYIKQYYLKEQGEAHWQFMAARVEKDYTITRLLYDRFSTFPGMSVPRPLMCLPERLIVVFEESPGEDLQTFIQRHAVGWPSRRTLRCLLEYCERCGEWLHRFQQMLPSQRQYSIAEMWAYVDHRLQQLVTDANARFSESLRQQLRRYFEKLQTRSQDLDLRMAAVHADFCSGNVLVDPSGVTVIDLAMFGEGSIYQDLTQFYHQLDLVLLKPIYRPGVIQQLQQAFLRGYGGHIDPHDPMFEAFRLRHLTTHLCGVLNIPHPPLRERLYNRWVCRHHRYWLERLSSE